MRFLVGSLFILMALMSAYFLKNKIRNLQELELIDIALKLMPEGCLITDETNTIVYINAYYSKLTGYAEHEVLGQNPSILSSGRQGEDFYREMWSTLEKDGVWEGEIWNRRKSGALFPEWLKIRAINIAREKSKSRTYHVGVFSDITVRKNYEKEITQYAFYDPVTALPNRRLFLERLEHALFVAKREKQKLAVLFLDLDHFKDVNDNYGHLIGDQLLCAVAKSIKAVLREVDTLSRFGGDEFVILLPNVDSKDAVGQFLERLFLALKTFSLVIESQKISIQASVGGAQYPDDATDTEALIKCADTAMYAVKNTTRNAFLFYEKKMH